MMNTTPIIDPMFDLEQTIKDYGFEIDEKDSGACVAHKYYYPDYGEILVEFNQSFLTNYQTDMRVFYRNARTHESDTLFLGVAPTNRRDFNMLMELLLPSEEFRNSLGIMV